MPSETIDTKEILKGLLTAFDSNNSFITGHQVVRTLNAGLKRETPDWAVNDKQIRELLLRSFPKLAIDSKQRKYAGRWMIVIQLYFRLKKSRREVAEEMSVSENVVRKLVQHIKWAAAGQRARNGEPRSNRVAPTEPLLEERKKTIGNP